ncbi:hypothetical protein SDRG_07803 [Saprolegnia diclina VS20]|uniref:Uncharacterized protein n=1 Tax=Saprolegnia diclina (strain VS20) TaxID=1156394 RepID=T0Q9D3_SAPDV|nr:hypothetical protein SDRG_07803 [Saprolegnia diclina VS20]EQC34474.1 hypothetical protein SDRG_07803 [Saprolegnia diclina VS20]|eukprot:XP_008611880.1 hypothetical protein SDRG_07803 [Saprolegnia diclina VS20]
MHRNWANDDDDADGAWMDEEPTTYSPYYASTPYAPPPLPPLGVDAWSEAEAVAEIHAAIGDWQRRFAVNDETDDYVQMRRKQDAWQAIAAKVDHVSRYLAAPPPKPLSVASTPRHSESETPEANWAGLWYLLGDMEDDDRRRSSESRMPGDAYVLLQIWSCLDSRDFANVAGVCSDWFRLVYHSKLGQQRWQQIVKRRWKHLDFENDRHLHALCPDYDWRKRYIALHRLVGNWRHGRHNSRSRLVPTPAPARSLAVLSPTHLVVGDARGHVRYLNIASSDDDPVVEYRAHGYSVSTLAVRSSTLVSGSMDGLLLLHDTERMASLGRLDGHLDAVTSAEFVASSLLLTASMDATVRLWDTRSGAPPVVFEDGSTQLGIRHATSCPEAHTFFTFAADGVASVWDLRRATTPLRVLRDPIPGVASCWLSPRTCVVLDAAGNCTWLKNGKVSGSYAGNGSRPLGVYTTDLDPSVLVIATSDGVQVCGDATSSSTIAALYSVPLSLRCVSADRTSLYGIDVAHQLHQLAFAP